MITPPKKNKFLIPTVAISLITAIFCGALYYSKINTAESSNDKESIVEKITKTVSNVSTAIDLKSYFEAKNTQRTFLVLFQNDMELRPGGGYQGSYGIITVSNGQIIKTEIYDTNVMDNKYSSGEEAPYPFTEWISIPEWEMRDANWSPDFKVNAEKTIGFYNQMAAANPEYKRTFDGVVAINTDVLLKLLEFTGPITLEEYGVTFTSENAQHELEYFVEQEYKNQDIELTDRKAIIGDLAKNILKKVQGLGNSDKAIIATKLFGLLDAKDIMVFSYDEKIQEEIEKKDWGGRVQETDNEDYLMIVDANVGSMKMDPFIERTAEYDVDFSSGKGVATLKLTYTNTLTQTDWRTAPYYRSYTRVYIPNEAWLKDISGNTGKTKFGEDLNKKYFGFEVDVPLGGTTEIVLTYELPEKITQENYQLIYQEQSGADRELIQK